MGYYFEYGREAVATVQRYIWEINHAPDKKAERRLLRELRAYQDKMSHEKSRPGRGGRKEKSMNTICNVRREAGGWRVEARTPYGAPVVVYSLGSRREAIDAACWAEPEPA